MEKWIKRVDFAKNIAITQQEKFDARYDLSKYDSYTFDLKTGEIMFSKEGEILTVKSQIVGSIYHSKEGVDVWVWSWEDEYVGKEAKSEMEDVREFGKKENFPAILNSYWEAEEIDALQMSIVALSIIDGQTIYCCSLPSNDYYFVIKSANVDSKTKLKQRRKM